MKPPFPKLIPLADILELDEQRPHEAYIAERRRIEAAHSDGCERPTPDELRKRYEKPAPLDDETITDESPLAALGLPTRCAEPLEKHGVETVGDLRQIVADGTHVFGCGEGAQKLILEALEGLE